MDDFATGYLAGQDGGNNNGGFFGNEGLGAVIIPALIFVRLCLKASTSRTLPVLWLAFRAVSALWAMTSWRR